MSNPTLVSKINERLFNELSDIYDEENIGEDSEADACWSDNVIAALEELLATYHEVLDDQRNG